MIYLDNKNLPKSTPTITWEGRHVLASITVSVASNTTGYTEPKTFVRDGDAFSLMSKMMDYLTQLSDVAFDRLARRYDVVFRGLRWVEEETTNRERLALGTDMTMRIDKIFEKLLEELEDYIRDQLVIGFNSKPTMWWCLTDSCPQYVWVNNSDILAHILYTDSSHHATAASLRWKSCARFNVLYFAEKNWETCFKEM